MESGTFRHDGVVFHYESAGGGKNHIVLQHGLSDYGPCWGDMFTDLSKRGYMVATMDARGHGRSGKPDDGYDLNTMTSDMMAFIQHLKLNRPIVIGHSMGASMAARAASRYPEALRGAILIDPVFQDIPDEAKKLAINKRKKDLQGLKKLSFKEIREYTLAKHPTWNETYVEAYAMSKILASENIFKIIDTIDLRWRDDLEKGQCPMMLITADVDRGAIITPETSQWIHEKHPEIEIVHTPNVGHSPHREDYPLVFNAILRFLDKQFKID